MKTTLLLFFVMVSVMTAAEKTRPFLASDDAGWLTGEIIFANGGNK